MQQGIYEDIARRTGGDVYIGVVGPVRTGKSTFIKRFMETLVLPRIEDEYRRERARDELPQSGSGRTIMTAEPKFVPEEAVEITLPGGAALSVRLVDSVGYLVEGALGHLEGDAERRVTTPWFPEEVPISVAAEEGTRRVITDHATLGIVVTNDGTITDIPRAAYVPAEERAVRELKALGKPFLLLVNSVEPAGEAAQALAAELGEKYAVTSLAVNCMTLTEEDITGILRAALQEFPVAEYAFTFPSWLEALPEEHPLKAGLYASVREELKDAALIREALPALEKIGDAEKGVWTKLTGLDLGSGRVKAEVEVPRALFYETVGELSGFAVRSDGDMLRLLGELAGLKSRYERVAEALEEAEREGYGVVMPAEGELILREPEIVRKGGRYAVRLKATAPAIHLIRTEVETEVSPAMGGEKSSGDIISFLLQEYEGDTGKLWESNLFGRSLHDIAADSLRQKIRDLPPDTRAKLRDALGKITNDSAGGLICIVL